MNTERKNKDLIKKITVIGLLTALATVFSFIKIPIFGSVTITLVLPVVVIGAALYGPLVGAWLTVIPNINSFGEAAMFLTWNPAGGILTIILKGIFAGLAAGYVYKLNSKKHPIGAVTCSAVVAPIVNTGTFFLGCFIFIWDELVQTAAEKSIGIGMLLLGLGVINFVIELILDIMLCPAILRIIQMAKKNKIT